VKPFDDKRVRQAISYAIDRKFIAENVWFGFARPATGPISSNFKASGLYTDQVKRYDVPDAMQRAEKLLDQAGYPKKAGGQRMEITLDVTPYGEEWQRFGEYVAQRLATLGIKATIRYEDVATWLKRTYTDFDFQVTANWLNTFADPVLGVHRLYHSEEIIPGTVFKNAARWSSPRTDQLMNLAKVEPDPKKRAAYYHEFQKILTEEVPVAWCVEILFPTVTSRKFKKSIDSAVGLAGNFRSTVS
jgi:peptide/nickel transport system substrate-binding protein